MKDIIQKDMEFTQQESNSLILLNNFLRCPAAFVENHDNKNALELFLSQAVHGGALNKKIVILMKNNYQRGISSYDIGNDVSIDLATFAFISAFTYYTRNYDSVPDIQRLQYAVECISNGVENDDKFSPRELGCINDLSEIFYIVTLIDKHQLCQEQLTLSELCLKIKLCYALNKMLKSTMFRSAIEVDDEKKAVTKFDKSNILRSLVDYYVKITNLSTIRAEPEFLQSIKDHCVQMSHEDLLKQIFGDFYKININKLFAKENYKVLQKIYGKQWREEVLSMIKEIENKMIANFFRQTSNDAQNDPDHLKAFGEMYQNHSACLDFQQLNECAVPSKYAMSKDPYMLMLSSKAEIVSNILQDLELNIKNAIKDQNLPINLDKDFVLKKDRILNQKHHI